MPNADGSFTRIDIKTGKPWPHPPQGAYDSAHRRPQMAKDSGLVDVIAGAVTAFLLAEGGGPPRGAEAQDAEPSPEQTGKTNYSEMLREAGRGAGWSDDEELNAEAGPPKSEAHRTAMGAGGIPERAHAFLRTRLVPDDYQQFLGVLKRAANARPMAGDSLRLMDRRPASGRGYYSTFSDHYVQENGVTTRRPPRPMDLSRANRELDDIIAGRR